MGNARKPSGTSAATAPPSTPSLVRVIGSPSATSDTKEMPATFATSPIRPGGAKLAGIRRTASASSPSTAPRESGRAATTTVTMTGSVAITTSRLERRAGKRGRARTVARLRQRRDDREQQLSELRVVRVEHPDHLFVRDRRRTLDANVVIGDQRDVRVAELELARQDRLGVAGHADHVPALRREPRRLGAGREPRSLDDDRGPAVMDRDP